MKKRILITLILFIVTLGFYHFTTNTAQAAAEIVSPAYQIGISHSPDKTVYSCGDQLDLTGLKLESYHYDGTIREIKDYTTEGYSSNTLGVQTVYLHYQGFTANFQVTVLPAKVKNIRISNNTAASYTLSWDAANDVTYYEIYSRDDTTGVYSFAAMTTDNNYTFLNPGEAVKSYQIRTVKNLNGVIYTGEFSDSFIAATSPEAVTGLTVLNTTNNSIELTWSTVNGATGYQIFRKTSDLSEFAYCGTTTSASYNDTKVSSSTGYQYKVCAYRYSDAITGAFSPVVDTSTAPATVVLKSKAGDKRIRLTWGKVTGASYYEIYTLNDQGIYELLVTKTGTDTSHIVEGLTDGETQSFYVIACRSYQNKIYSSPQSNVAEAAAVNVDATSTAAKYFADKKAFQSSNAYNNISFFQSNVNYSKSYVIPGLISTNVGGFHCSTMCPQGITFVKNYLLITAYDLSGEENSVIYCLNKNSKKLLTTLILPTKAHVGGICYDGTYLWVTTGSKVSCFPYSDISAAIKAGNPYSDITFFSICKAGIASSYITYYDDKLWVGTYDELKSTYMYSFSIDDFGTSVELTKEDTIIMPTRVQGIDFTKDGYLILSRSCQLYEGLRGYMRQIEFYQPDFSDEDVSEKSLGPCLNYIEMPSMNEGIAINGSYLYVIFESAAFPNASYTMDRVCAFRLSSILRQNTENAINAKQQ